MNLEFHNVKRIKQSQLSRDPKHLNMQNNRIGLNIYIFKRSSPPRRSFYQRKLVLTGSVGLKLSDNQPYPSSGDPSLDVRTRQPAVTQIKKELNPNNLCYRSSPSSVRFRTKVEKKKTEDLFKKTQDECLWSSRDSFHISYLSREFRSNNKAVVKKEGGFWWRTCTEVYQIIRPKHSDV